MPMVNAMPRLPAAGDPIPRNPPGSALADLFEPLDGLLVSGGDPRLRLDPATGTNEYGCRPHPCPDTLSFASCTATSISERAYGRVSQARDELMQSVIKVGLEAAFDARIEAMREELKAAFGLPPREVEVVFSPSGTDAQLQALWLAQVWLGPALTTVIVAADQTGSGTADTARGRHFSAATASGSVVRKGEPIEGLADGVESVAISLRDETGGFRSPAQTDTLVLDAVEQAVANDGHVMLQIMDSSKLGWRAPSEACLDQIAARWPGRVQIVVDACQMRLGRPRLRNYLARGYIVIVTGSKFFTGPAFSGALLVPGGVSSMLDSASGSASGLSAYSGRSDWPMRWPGVRSRFPVRANFGQWLRWEAALEEIRCYFGVPDEIRRTVLAAFGQGTERIIEASPSLRLLPRWQPAEDRSRDEELAPATIFPFLISHRGRLFSPGECRKVYRALARIAATGGPATAARACQIGQPVALGDVALGDVALGNLALGELERQPAAALRICASARLVTEAFASDQNGMGGAIQHELERVGVIVAKLEWLVAHPDGQEFADACHEA